VPEPTATATEIPVAPETTEEPPAPEAESSGADPPVDP
jgi:hypothetical protein